MAASSRTFGVSSKKARRGERHFRDLLEAAPDAIIEVDRDGQIVLLNEMTERLFGYEREELLGQPVEVLHLSAAHAHKRSCVLASAAHAPAGFRVAGEAQGRNLVSVEISLGRVKSGEGFSVIAIIRDVGERRNAEDQVHAVQEQFIGELQLRNREIARADRLKSEFLSSMSHEIRTPLQTIIGFTELLAEELKGPLNQDQKRFVQHVHTDSLHLLKLINEILDLGKIEAGRIELRSETFDMSAAIEEVLCSIQPHGEAKSIRIESRLAARLTVHADCLRFKQILFNLLSNAVKFTPEGGAIRIDASRRDNFVEIAVSDNGIGVGKHEHELIFDKFHQVSETNRGMHEGTGLGLAITKALVEQHGGRIWIDSEPGKGSRFTFTIPAGAAAARVHAG